MDWNTDSSVSVQWSSATLLPASFQSQKLYFQTRLRPSIFFPPPLSICFFPCTSNWLLLSLCGQFPNSSQPWSVSQAQHFQLYIGHWTSHGKFQMSKTEHCILLWSLVWSLDLVNYIIPSSQGWKYWKYCILSSRPSKCYQMLLNWSILHLKLLLLHPSLLFIFTALPLV